MIEHTNKNLGFIRSCAEVLGATEEAMTELEKTEYRAQGEWDNDQAARLWGRQASGSYLEKLGIQPDAKLQRGDRVLDTWDPIYLDYLWTITACGEKQVTVEQDTWHDSFPRGGTRTKMDATEARRRFIVVPPEHEDAVIGFIVGYRAARGIENKTIMSSLEAFVVFRARLFALLRRLQENT